MRRVLCALLVLVGLAPATLHAAPAPTYASFDARTDVARSYVGARYYASQTGRFTSVDPVGVNPLWLVNRKTSPHPVWSDC